MTAASLLEIVKAAWGWHGIDPVELVEQNRFGNVIVKTSAGHFWRICPEELGARRVAESDTDFKKLRADPEFIRDWTMSALTQRAEEKLGFPGEGRCYCLKIPAVMGGKYDSDNLGTIALAELLSASGDLAQQIDGLPEGTKVELVVGSRPIEP